MQSKRPVSHIEDLVYTKSSKQGGQLIQRIQMIIIMVNN